MKKIFICGDSFGSTDPLYPGLSWAELLESKLPDNYQLINLSAVAASNLHISLQIDYSILNAADFIIYLATASFRGEVKFAEVSDYDNLLDRFVTIGKNNHLQKNLTTFSYLSLDNNNFLNNNQKQIIKSFYVNCIDENLLIYQNKCIIENALQKLVNSNIPFVFDQGGFEHPKFTTEKKKYFENYKNYFSALNLWDYVEYRALRPYFHITNQTINQNIANYYYKKILSIK